MEARVLPAPYRKPLPVPAAETAPQVRAKPSVPARTAVKTRAGARAAEAMKLRFRTVALFVAGLTILLVIVYSYMQVSQLSREYVENTALLQQLKKEEKTLTHQVEANVSLAEVEEYAVRELGMVKPSADQIVYISLAGEDEAEVIPVKGFWGSVKQLFSTSIMKMKEFFD